MVDHDLPPRLARALNVIFEPEHQIVALADKFGRSNLTDEEWMVELGREGGWAALSRDIAIAKKRPSRAAFLTANLVGFFLSPSMQKWELTKQFARVLTVWPTMVTISATTANGVYEVPASATKFRTIGR